jgi:hypothetical protein
LGATLAADGSGSVIISCFAYVTLDTRRRSAHKLPNKRDRSFGQIDSEDHSKGFNESSRRTHASLPINYRQPRLADSPINLFSSNGRLGKRGPD